ncbi:cobalamin-binding protein [soil metagenome]
MSYTELDLEELYLQMQDDLYDGVKEEIPIQVRAALEQGQTPQQILDGGLVAGMDIVGVDFRDGILFVPEVLMAANAMKAGMEILRPLLTETGAERVGTAVIGTVKGDIHDIGKNLVGMMLEGAGFEVINLGINVDADKFIAAINEYKPDIIGMSALLTTTMPYMKVVVDTLGEEGLRDEIYIMVGGAPVTENFAREVGADAYGRDAAVSVEIAKRYMARKHKQARDDKAAKAA